MRAVYLWGISTRYNKGVGIPTFAEDDRIGGRPSLVTNEGAEWIMQKATHNKQQIHGVDARHHKPGMSVDVFQVVLLSSVSG